MKKLLLTLATVLAVACMLTLAVGAINFNPNASNSAVRTYVYYENEIADGNELYRITAQFEGRGRYEIVTSKSGVGFAKTDENGVPLTWYVVSDDNDADKDNVHNIVVKSVPTVQAQGYGTYAGTITNGVYSYNAEVISAAQKVVSANFTGLKITSISNGFNATSNVLSNHTTEYCEVAGTAYLLFAYFPDDLTAMPSLQKSPVLVCEFENNTVKFNNMGASFSWCANLEELRIPEGITTFGDKAYREMLSLQYIRFPNTATAVNSYNNSSVFFRNNSMTTIVFGAKMTTIGKFNSNPETMTTNSGMNVLIKEIYIPKTFNSNLGDVLNGTRANKGVIFFFVGTKAEAKAKGNTLGTNFQAAVNGGEQKFISYETYLSDVDAYRNLDYDIVVYGLNECEVFYDGLCDVDSTAFGSTCTRCEKALENPFDGFMYATKEDGGDISAIVFSYDIDQALVEEYERKTGKDLMFGVITFKAENLGTDGGKYINPSYQIKYNVTADGTTLPKLSFDISKASNADLSTTGLAHVDLILRGQTTLWESSMIDVPLYMIGYIYDGENAYFMGSKDGKDVYSTDINDVATIYYKKTEVFVDGDFEYVKVVNGSTTTAKVVGYIGTSKIGFTVPQKLGGYKVSAIGNGAFDGYGAAYASAGSILAINLPSTVTLIEANAFANCNNINIQMYSKISNGVPTVIDKVATLQVLADGMTVEESGNDHVIEVILNKRPAIGWNKYN